MSKSIRRVPENWKHPKNENGFYIPLYEKFPYNEEEIMEGLEDGWLDSSKENLGIDVMPQWNEEEKTHIQLYETCTEGTPVSPIFPADQLEKLCEWAAENANTFADFKTSKEKWFEMLTKDFVHHQQGNIIFM